MWAAYSPLVCSAGHNAAVPQMVLLVQEMHWLSGEGRPQKLGLAQCGTANRFNAARGDGR